MRTSALLLALALSACVSDADRQPDADAVAAEAEREAADATALGTGDLAFGADLDGETVETITTREGDVEMGLTETVLFVRLSAQARKEVSEEIAAETEAAEGLGGRIARMAAGAVERGLATAVQVPVADVRSVRVENGALVIEMEGGEASPFRNSESDGRPLLEQFAPADAERLAEAFARVKR